MSRTAKAEEPKPRTYIRRFDFGLSEQEIIDRSEEGAQCRLDIAAVESEKKEVNEGFKKRITAFERRAAQIDDSIRTRRELRPLEVFDKRNEPACTIETYRADDGEFIESRPMTYDERQLVMWPDNVTDPAPEADEIIDSAIDRLNQEAGDDDHIEGHIEGDTVTLWNPNTGKGAKVSSVTLSRVAKKEAKK